MYRTVFLKNSILIICWFLIASSCKQQQQTSLPYYNTPSFSSVFFTNKEEALQKTTHTIAAFSFTDQHGHIINQDSVAGKIHVANFIFTTCISICPVMTKHMKLLQTAFENNPDVALLSYSVTPWIDSVGQLKKYAERNDITASNWHLLTGSQSQIYTLARQSYFAEEDLGFTKDSSEFLHTEHILLVDKSNRIRGIYNGTLELEAIQLKKDIELLLQEE